MPHKSFLQSHCAKKPALLIAGLAIFILCLPHHIAFAASTDETALRQQIDAKQQLIKQLEDQIAQYQSAITTTHGQAATLNAQIKNLNQKIQSLTLNIRLTQAKIDDANLQIQSLESQIEQKSADLDKNQQFLSSAVLLKDQMERESLVISLLRSGSLEETFQKITQNSQLQQALSDHIQQVQSLKQWLEDSQNTLVGTKQQLTQSQMQLQSQNVTLSDTRTQKSSLLTATQNQEKKYQALLKSTQAQQDQIQQDIATLEDKLRQLINPSSLPSTGTHLLAWPAQGRISQGYGSTSVTGFINNSYTFHNGIDIAAPIGAPVHAAYDGIVVGVGNDGNYAYGRWVAIRHPNGLTTLYGHFSVVKVVAGQQVSKGDIIGAVGETGFATGPHLHFTVYATNTFSIAQKWYGALPTGGSLNPMNYL